MFQDVLYDLTADEAISAVQDRVVCLYYDDETGKEVHVYWRAGKYKGEGDFVAVKEYVRSNDDLRNSSFESFDTVEEAIEQLHLWINRALRDS